MMHKRLKGQHKDKEKEELLKAFRLLDKDGNDRVSKEQLREVLCNSGEEPMTPEAADAFFREADVDGDGYLNFEGEKTVNNYS